MSQFVRVYTPSKNDEALKEAQLLIMRRESSPYLEVEEGDLPRALDLLPGAIQYSKGLVVHEGLNDTSASHRSIGATVRSIWNDIAADNTALIKLNNQAGFGTVPEVITDGTYYINLYALPKEPFEDNLPGAVNIPVFNFEDEGILKRDAGYDITGYDSSSIRESLSGTEQNFEVLEDDSGNIFALYTPFNAWVTIRCARNEDLNLTEEGKTTLEALFKRLFASMNGLVPDMGEFMAQQERIERLKTLDGWSRLVAGRHDENVKQLKGELEEAVNEIDRQRKEQTETLQQVTELKKVIEIAANVRPDTSALAKEFDQISESPHIDRVEVDEAGEAIKIYTHMIVMDGDEDIKTGKEEIRESWTGMQVPIGKFCLTLKGNGSVDIQNLTNTKKRTTGDGGDWHHPHVPVGGSPCLGTIERALPQLMAKYEFGSAAHLLIQYLSCCNADDAWGAQIFLWKEDAYPKARIGASTSEGAQEAEVVDA